MEHAFFELASLYLEKQKSNTGLGFVWRGETESQRQTENTIKQTKKKEVEIED